MLTRDSDPADSDSGSDPILTLGTNRNNRILTLGPWDSDSGNHPILIQGLGGIRSLGNIGFCRGRAGSDSGNEYGGKLSEPAGLRVWELSGSGFGTELFDARN